MAKPKLTIGDNSNNKVDKWVKRQVAPTPADSGVKRLTIDIPEELHSQLKKKVVDDKTTVKKIVTEFLQKYCGEK